MTSLPHNEDSRSLGRHNPHPPRRHPLRHCCKSCRPMVMSARMPLCFEEYLIAHKQCHRQMDIQLCVTAWSARRCHHKPQRECTLSTHSMLVKQHNQQAGQLTAMMMVSEIVIWRVIDFVMRTVMARMMVSVSWMMMMCVIVCVLM